MVAMGARPDDDRPHGISGGADAVIFSQILRRPAPEWRDAVIAREGFKTYKHRE